MMLDMLNITPEDTLLDVACGGGLVACALAPKIKHATGIDITPVMIERAKQLERE
ncbi:Ubiquinone/menaquinone biosynthesis C-methyltransferase UbiE [uncultured archaeon]|nr:Ubiquinone/menaquinone biosynthesis C-methyltransferase UbiE [uncultured archaeon]